MIMAKGVMEKGRKETGHMMPEKGRKETGHRMLE